MPECCHVVSIPHLELCFCQTDVLLYSVASGGFHRCLVDHVGCKAVSIERALCRSAAVALSPRAAFGLVIALGDSTVVALDDCGHV